jgi:tRNA A-37 threonylcarbamoyl transferase component Bud32
MVVIKRNKLTKDFHEYLLAATYSLMSVLMAHPSAPPPAGKLALGNEGNDMRNNLKRLGIPTPFLISISADTIVEEYVEGGNLYKAFANEEYKENIICSLAFQAGSITGKLHKAGYVFTDNKSQNYLVNFDNSIVRTDLGFIHKSNSVFAQSMDIASFLASVIDFEQFQYETIEKGFRDGYTSAVKRNFPYLYILLRNILSLGFASDQSAMLQNMAKGSIQGSRKRKRTAKERN